MVVSQKISEIGWVGWGGLGWGNLGRAIDNAHSQETMEGLQKLAFNNIVIFAHAYGR